MRIERVDAVAFGPLSSAVLEPAPGMTVVHGPNEAGKSSWHAALYAGLCGMRRGPGRRTADRAFRARHRPWDSDHWEVGVVVSLSDGRRIELRHDLDGNVDATATDLATGRDLSPDIISDGAPDGARLLGLSRRTLPTTIWVRQAGLVLDDDDAEGLQHHLQRAAATAGAAATAAEALERVETFRATHVGSERSNSTKPLMTAVREVRGAEEHLAAARRSHERFRDIVRERDRLAVAAAAATERRDALRAAAAQRRIEDLAARLDRARRLADGSEADASPAAYPTKERDGSDQEATPSPGGRRHERGALAAGTVATLLGVALLASGRAASGAVLLTIGMIAVVGALLRRHATAREQLLRSEARRVLDEASGRRAAAEDVRRQRRSRELRDHVAELETELDRARAQADRVPSADGRRIALEQDVDAQLARAQDEAERARTAADRAAGEARQARATTPSIAAAEERLAQAHGELARLRGLRVTLDRTAEVLASARDAVHADIAPALNSGIARWLPDATGGRYDEALVDPETLRVRIRTAGGRWRDAALLSHGTAEQTYLLLRIAMAEHLGATEEPAPLILDDVTTQTDAERTHAVADLLHDVSRDRQVILFTQEDEVRQWASTRLDDPTDRLILLSRAPSGLGTPYHPGVRVGSEHGGRGPRS